MVSELGKNVFDPESMSQEFAVGGKTLKLLPIKLKAFRRIVSIVDDLGEKARAMPPGSKFKDLVDTALERQEEVLKLLFPNADFLTHEFIEDNMSLAQTKEILAVAMVTNGLDAWFPHLAPYLGVRNTETP